MEFGNNSNYSLVLVIAFLVCSLLFVSYISNSLSVSGMAVYDRTERLCRDLEEGGRLYLWRSRFSYLQGWYEDNCLNKQDCSCDSVEECNKILDGSCNVVKLSSDITDIKTSGSVFEFSSDSVKFDCQNHKVVGNGVRYGIGIDTKGYDNLEVTNCIIQNFNTAIFLREGSDNVKVFRNKLSANSRGVFGVGAGSNHQIIENSISNNVETFTETGAGIILSSSGDGTLIIGNAVFDNEMVGIFLHNTGNSVVESNIVRNNWIGILTQNKGANTITNNSVFLNSLYGILVDGSYSNVISRNIIFANKKGIELLDDDGYYSNNNNIYSNVACNNTEVDLSDHTTLSTGNIYKGNICQKTENWIDAGSVGCSILCSDYYI